MGGCLGTTTGLGCNILLFYIYNFVVFVKEMMKNKNALKIKVDGHVATEKLSKMMESGYVPIKKVAMVKCDTCHSSIGDFFT